MSESFFLPCEYYDERDNHLFPKGCELLAQQAKHVQYELEHEKYTIRILVPNHTPTFMDVGKFLNYSIEVLFQARLIPSKASQFIEGIFLTYVDNVKPHYYNTELTAVSYQYLISFYPIRQKCYPEKDK